MSTRRTFLQSVALAIPALYSRMPLYAQGSLPHLEDAPPLDEFGYGDVTLAPGRALDQFQNTQSVLMGLNADGLMKPWRLRAGLPAPGHSLGGWYAADGFCPGHTFGQWISALARGYAATRDTRTQAHINHLLALYQPAISGKFYTNFRFPAYVFDKVVCGMIDAHQFAHSKLAFPILDQTVDAALPHLPPHALDRDQPQLAWRAATGQKTTPDYGWDESYTLPENLYLAWQRGAGARYKTLAGRYLLDKTYFDPLAAGHNVLAHHHAYSFCNALSSAMQAYICTGSRKHLRAAMNAFHMIDTTQSFATGGWGPNEAFVEPGSATLFDSLSKTHASFETPCGSYAHFKLTRYLLRVTRDGRYGDSMERVFYNTVLGAKHLEPDGHAFYYSDYNFEGKRVYFHDRWPCCSGTLPQVAADYHILGYFHEGNTLYVNLYLPSTLRWTTPDGVAVGLTQETEYPLEGNVVLHLNTSHPAYFALRLRIPGWARGAQVRVNGTQVSAPVERGFATLHRQWKSGDRIELTLPLPMRLEAIDERHTDTVALVRGPLVLFALNTQAPRVKRQQLLAAERGPGKTLEEATWNVQTASGAMRVVPFTGLGEDRYTAYVNVS